MLLITSADHYIGHSIISHLSRYPALRQQLRVFCENKTRCLNFAKKGIDVRQVDYTQLDHIAQAMHGVDHMILAIGHEADRVHYCENLCRAASKAGVKSIICISNVGAVSTTYDMLQQYAQIEDAVISTDCQWTILRLDWIAQMFHFWAPFVEKHQVLPMPFPEDVEICPIDITDVCRVTEQLVLNADKTPVLHLLDHHSGQVYVLSGPQSVTGKDLVGLIKNATGLDKFSYRMTRPMDIRYYLSDLSKDIWFDARLKHESNQVYNDTMEDYSYRTRIMTTPTKSQIDTYLEYFDWVRTTAGSVQVSHATQITNVPARPIFTFFQENAYSFKPRAFKSV